MGEPRKLPFLFRAFFSAAMLKAKKDVLVFYFSFHKFSPWQRPCFWKSSGTTIQLTWWGGLDIPREYFTILSTDGTLLLPLPLDCCVLWCLALLSGVSLANITSPVHSVDRRRFKHSISQSFLCVMESMACRGVVKVFWVVRPDIVAVALQVEVPLLQVATRVGMTIVAPSTCLKSHVTFYMYKTPHRGPHPE